MMLEATLSEHCTVLASGDGVPTCHDVRRHPEHSTVLESGDGFPYAESSETRWGVLQSRLHIKQEIKFLLLA